MGDVSNIAWTDSTLNPWIGCTKVGPGCDGCYAEAWDARFNGGGHWGPGAPRRRTTPQNWNKALRWEHEAVESGKRRWVFCASLADVFDNEVPADWRADLFELWRATPHLNWQVVTKRITNAAKILPESFGCDFPHIGIIVTVVTQAECDRDLPRLLALKDSGKASWIGLSIEPQLENVIPDYPVDWAITGGESDQGGARGRDYRTTWAGALIHWGESTSTPIFVKQMGSEWARRHGKQDRAGADPNEWPEWARVREMPRGIGS